MSTTEPTSAQFELFCLVYGEWQENDIFPVHIERSAKVAALKEVIKKKRDDLFGEINAVKLILRNVSIPVDRDLKVYINGTKLGDPLGPTKSLSKVFPSSLPEDTVHVLVEVKVPEVATPELPSLIKTHLTSVAHAHEALAPSSVANSISKFVSEQNKHPIYNGRPRELRGPPVTIYDSSLANLKQELSDLSIAPEPDLDCLKTTAKLFLAATHIYDNEDKRGEVIYPHVARLLGTSLEYLVKVPEQKSKRKTAEGDALLREELKDGVNKAVVVYIELKNELGLCGVGGLQAALSLRKHLSQTAYTEIRNASCCPCIVLSLAGPHLQVFGAVFVDVFVVQHFTQILSLDDTYDAEQINYVAKAFTAVERAVRTLQYQYYHLDLNQRPECLPCPTYLPNSPLPGSLIFKDRFYFEGRDPSNHSRTLFLAEYNTNAVLVKFCERYSEAAHNTLAAEGLAPTLYFCTKIVGKGFMVIMDLIDGRDAYHLFKRNDLPSTVVEDVKRAVKKLHDADLVFGDMRRPNIMVRKSQVEGEEEWHGVLVDFDWAGSVGKAKYPANLNTFGEIKWADGVVPMGEIKKQHDLDMIESIIRDKF